MLSLIDFFKFPFYLMNAFHFYFSLFFSKIFSRLNVKLGEVSIYNKTNRETSVEIRQSVRGKHVFIIQSGSK